MESPNLDGICAKIISDEAVQATVPRGSIIPSGNMLRLIDLEGQQAVDFLCYDANNPAVPL